DYFCSSYTGSITLF
nr:immunoglobulin light chain junction region [Macaca mulatta]MOV72457.1 immunoglobulin light chain junction region [Macaca mulatta]MOV72779.1 immunoglobulin light chain junction region [Macaca mulatta]MOV72815.1 immunoglobulin light chain junction region [Macaca mulatta]MOV72845.1 immunoglobulin light chain junction region [Macaca mulatta]